MRLFSSTLIIMTLLFAGCEQPDPYKIKKPDFTSKVHTIGIMPTVIDSNMEIINPEEKEKEFEALIESRLKDAGVNVVPCSQLRAVYQRMKKKIGPLPDTNIDESLVADKNMLWYYSKREYLANHKVDALAWPIIEHTVAFDRSGKYAVWDGTKQPVMEKDDLLGMMLISQYTVPLPAFSLKLTIAEPNGQTLYENRGGIQLLALLVTNANGNMRNIPIEKVLADKKINKRSVDIACQPLFKPKKKSSSGTSSGSRSR